MGLWFAVALLLRLRFQFSIRTLLVLAAVVAVPFSWLAAEMKRAREQKEVVTLIERLAGDVIYDWEFDKSGILANELPLEPTWLRTWLGNDFFGEVVEAELGGTQVTDRDVGQVKRLDHLRKLWMERTQITDVGLEQLAGLTQLQDILVGGTQITDVGLTHIARMTKLQRLGLGRTQITDTGLAHLVGLTKLEWLSLDDTKITNTGLSHLAGLMQLEVLWLENTQITDSGRHIVPGCKNSKTWYSSARMSRIWAWQGSIRHCRIVLSIGLEARPQGCLATLAQGTNPAAKRPIRGLLAYPPAPLYDRE